MSSLFNTRLIGSIWHVVTGGKSGLPPESQSPVRPQLATGMGPNTGGDHFVGLVPRPLRHGDVVIISGTVTPQPEQFSINLCCDTHHHHSQQATVPREIAYHSKTLFAEDCVVTNYKRSGRWGDEYGPHSNPFVPGESFTVSIHLTEDEIVTYEGDSNYLHSLPWSEHRVGDITTVQVWYDVRHVRELSFRFADS